MSIYSKLYSSGSYVVLNKNLIKHLGVEGAVMLSELADEEAYFSKRNMCTEDGFFFSTCENLQSILNLSEYKQRTILKDLQEKNLITIQFKDMSGRRYIKLNDDAIFGLLYTPADDT